MTAPAAEAKRHAASSTSASVTSTIASRSATAMCSSGVWISVIPFARLSAREAALVEDVRVGGAAGEREAARSRSARARRGRGEAHGLVACGSGSRGSLRSIFVSTSHSASAAANAKASEHLLDEVRELRLVVASAPRRRNVHHSGTMLRAVPPVIVPTLAVVSSSTRPSRRSAIARAAAAIAERPSSGNMPECEARPWKRTSMRTAERRAEDHLADRRRLVVDEAELGVQPRVVEGGGAAQADLLLRA